MEEKDRLRVNANNRRWSALNREYHRKRNALYRENNKESIRAKNHKNYINNKNLICDRSRAWSKAHPEYAVIKHARRTATKLGATVRWANKFFICEIYRLARLRTISTNVCWEVDHIVPIQSKLVCGLHWEGNMQVITKVENIMKGNKFWPDMP